MVKQSSSLKVAYKVGDSVWMSTSYIQLQDNKQFIPKWFELFKIMKVVNNACQLRFPSSIHLHLVINVGHLKKFILREDDDPMQILKEPRIIDWSGEFEVWRIIGHRRVEKEWRFLVEWKGWNVNKAIWECVNQFEKCSRKIMRISGETLRSTEIFMVIRMKAHREGECCTVEVIWYVQYM